MEYLIWSGDPIRTLSVDEFLYLSYSWRREMAWIGVAGMTQCITLYIAVPCSSFAFDHTQINEPDPV